jgi:hypothetical protein
MKLAAAIGTGAACCPSEGSPISPVSPEAIFSKPSLGEARTYLRSTTTVWRGSSAGTERNGRRDMSRSDLHLVVNTSPLIHLAEADLLHRLQDAAPVHWVPEPVAEETRPYGDGDPTARASAKHRWLEVRPAIPLTPETFDWNPGPGDDSVIELAHSLLGRKAVVFCVNVRHAEVMAALFQAADHAPSH